jgi:PAS domain-containing protein
MAMSRSVQRNENHEPGPWDLAWSEVVSRNQLATWADVGDSGALVEFATSLGHRGEALAARDEDLAQRERQLGLEPPAGAGVEDSLALAGVRACIRSLVVETGDDVATVAASLDLDPEWARGVLAGAVTELDRHQTDHMAAVLESSPEELFVVSDLGAYANAMLDAARAPAPGTASGALPAVHHLVDAAGAVPAAELRAFVACLERDERLQFVDALQQRHGALCRWSADLDRRQERLVRAGPEPSVYAALRRGAQVCLPAAPAAGQIALLIAETGDDLDTVARAVGMDPARARGVVDGDIDWLDASEAQQLCAALELAPSEVFGAGAEELVVPSSPESDVVRRIKAVAGALVEELGIEAAERGLEGRERDHWVERRLDELTDPFTTLPENASPVVALAGDYRRLIEGVERGDLEVEPYGQGPLELPDGPDLDLGP